MTQLPVLFRTKFQRAFEDSDFDSMRSLSEAANCSPNQASKIINGHFDETTTGPGIFTVYRLARLLGRSLDSLISDDPPITTPDINVFNKAQGQDPASFDSLMATHWRGGGRLEAFSDLEDYYDLYAAPDPDTPTIKLVHLGRSNLFAMRMQTTDVLVAQREIDRFTASTRRVATDFHQRVMEEAVVSDNVFLDYKLATRALHVRAGYSRLGLRVDDQNGKPLVLLACKPIPV